MPVGQHSLVPVSPPRDETSELAELLPAHGGCSRRKLAVKHTDRELCSLPGFGTGCNNNSPAPGWGRQGQARAGLVHAQGVQYCMQQGRGAALLQPWLCLLQHLQMLAWEMNNNNGKSGRKQLYYIQGSMTTKSLLLMCAVVFSSSDLFQVLIEFFALV